VVRLPTLLTLVVALAMTAACYRPELESCAVDCTNGGSSVCPPGQVCVEGGACAPEGITCPGGATARDGAVGDPDAETGDEIDAPTSSNASRLRVIVRRKGKVVVKDHGVCISTNPDAMKPAVCFFDATLPSTTFELTAEVTDGVPFSKWGQASQCDETQQERCRITVTTGEKKAVAVFNGPNGVDL